jgi:hypothetical protein
LAAITNPTHWKEEFYNQGDKYDKVVEMIAEINNSVKKSGDETVGGVKTFSSIPVLPASDPTADNQAARKAYVDSQADVYDWFGSDKYTIHTFGGFKIPLDPAAGVGEYLTFDNRVRNGATTTQPFIAGIFIPLRFGGKYYRITSVKVRVWLATGRTATIYVYRYTATDAGTRTSLGSQAHSGTSGWAWVTINVTDTTLDDPDDTLDVEVTHDINASDQLYMGQGRVTGYYT